MNRQEAQEFLKKHLLILVKDKDGKAQYPYKSINAHKQIAERLLRGLCGCMDVKCKLECKNEDGEKIMGFTKDNIYQANKISDECWEIEDDKGVIEQFFCLEIMFEEITG